jgi:hypothetical protein
VGRGDIGSINDHRASESLWNRDMFLALSAPSIHLSDSRITGMGDLSDAGDRAALRSKALRSADAQER